MVERYLVVFVAMMLLVFAGSALADEGGVQAAASERVDDATVDLAKPTSTPDLLEFTMNRWHEAVLNGNTRQARSYENELIQLVTDNVQSDRRLLQKISRFGLAGVDRSDEDSPNMLEDDQRTTLTRKDKAAIRQLVSVISTKQMLLNSIKRSRSFSNKYRLLGDYINLLRKELNMPRLKFAAEDEQE